MSETYINPERFYGERDRGLAYEHQWGYTNPIAAAYWRLRDEIVVAGISSRFDTLDGETRVLDVGCGYGHELSKLTALGIPQHRLCGVDCVGPRVERAQTLYPGIDFRRQDATDLQFDDHCFDIVLQFTCVMHGESPEIQMRMCQEMVRVLRPGGLIVWWDVVPPTRRVLVLRELCAIVTRADSRVSAGVAILRALGKRLRVGADCSHLEGRGLSTASYLLPVGVGAVGEFFPGLRVSALIAGLDYPIWQLVWRHSRPLASMLWRAGWLGSHCFALIEKGT